MKKKSSKFKKSIITLAILFMATVVSNAFGQQNGLWQAKGTDTTFTNREVLINKTLNVKGKTTCDSMLVKKYINADSIHVRSIKIGDSSLTLFFV